MKFRNGFATLAAAGLAMGLLGGVAAMGAHAQASGTPVMGASEENLLIITGTGEVQAAPNIARLTMGVQTQNVDAAHAGQENAVKSAALIAAIKAAGVADKDIQTTDYRISPQYDYTKRNSPPRVVGYEVFNSVRVTVRKISDAGKVLDAGIRAGTNDAGNIAFDLSDDSKLKTQAEALTRAVTNARSKADTLAKAAGTSILALYSISETGYGMVRPYFPESGGGAMRTMSAAPPPPVQAGELTVSATITVKYRMRP